MVKGTNQIITMLQFYLYLFFAFYILSRRRGRRRRMLRRARDLLGHLTGSPRLCVWGARWSDRDPPCLPNVATSSWFAPQPGWSAPRLLVQWSAASSAACVCKTHSVSGPSACLLRCCLLQKSAAAFCQSSLRPDCRQAQCSPCDEEEDYHNDDGQDEDDHCWDPIVSRLNVTMMRRLRRFWVTLLLMMRRLFLLLLFIYQHY